MVKHYCDRCGVECGGRELSTIRIPITKSKIGDGLSTEPLDVWPACKKEYDKIIDALRDIRFLMFDKFYGAKGE